MPTIDRAAARAVLRRNDRGNGCFTVPTAGLYPFQWNWDSGFVALGWGTFDADRAMRELETLFTGQWANGMVPHIVFHSETEDSYFPNWPFWETDRNAGAPRRPRTSGITQPPVVGFVLAELARRHPELRNRAAHLFPKVVAYHRWCYRFRDPEREGLFFFYHPWETGRDNSPLWDAPMNRIDLSRLQLPAYQRRDLDHADAKFRPTRDHYDRFVALLELGKRFRYDGEGIAAESPVLIQDSLMNALLIRSNAALIELGADLKLDTGELREWHQQSSYAFEKKLWNADLACYVPYDLRAEAQIARREVGGVASLFAQTAAADRVAALATVLRDWQTRGFLLCPSNDPDDAGFDPLRYWRGPVWPQMNWLLARGLAHYGENELSQAVDDDLRHSIERQGFYEYFDPRRAVNETLTEGYGGNHFSWTASTFLLLGED